jgi:DNA-binding NarL/FixJ family response regulator
MTTSVFVVDDHVLVRSGIAQLIRLEQDLEVNGDGPGTAETLDRIARQAPDVAVVDLEMPQIRGGDFIQSLKHRVPGIKALACTMHASRAYVAEAMRRGADAYVLKSSPSEWLLAAIRSVAAGKAYIDPSLQDEVVRLLQDRDAHILQSDLTAQESEVLQLVAEGLSNSEVARRTHQSLEAVKLRLRRCFQKLGATDRAHAVALAVRRHII